MTDPALFDRLRFGLRDDRGKVEHGNDFAPKFDGSGLITAIAVDVITGEILMVAYMNEESLKMTLRLGEAVYYSRSRQEIWHKGATSGNTQKIVEILTDCDQDALILRVEQTGSGACHTGARTCFYRRVDPELPAAESDAAVRLQPVAGNGAGI